MSNHSARRRRIATPPPAPSGPIVCVWPRCPKPKALGSELCQAHLIVAHNQFISMQQRHVSDTPAPKYVEPAKPERPTNGSIYFLRVGGYIKIGWTSNLEKRMRQYQPDSQLLAVMPGTRKDENALHRKFAHLKTHGREWFPLAPQIHEEAERIVAEHGAPPVVDFSARRAQRIVGPRLNKYVGGANRGNLPPRTVSG